MLWCSIYLELNTKEIDNGQGLKSEFREDREEYKHYLINIQEDGDMLMIQSTSLNKVWELIEDIQ